MKVTVLTENTSKNALEAEHGLSLWIEFQGKQYLLDAGSSELFLKNAKILWIPLQDADACILSHGHYDHSGGFEVYLEENVECSVYAMNNFDGEYYSASGGIHYIGVPKGLLEKYRDRFVRIHDVTKIAEHTYLVPHSTDGLEKIGEKTKLYVKKGEEMVADDFSHELSLVFDTEKGMVIFNSCSHGGMRNIINEVKKVLPNKKIYAFLGGLHMKGGNFSEEEIKELAEFLRREGVQYLYTGHCTGEAAMELLKKYAGDKVQVLYTGSTIML